MQDTAVNNLPFYDVQVSEIDSERQYDLPQFRRSLATVGIVARPGLIESNNFVSGSTGWQLTAAGNLEANSGTFRGALTASTITIGTGFNVDTSGNVWWGASATYAAATIKISSAGSVNFTTGTFSGVIQTATSGKRITINDTANTMIFYDSGAQVIGIGTDAGNAFTLALNSTTSNGMIISSAVAGFALSYSNSLSNLSGNAGVSVNLTGTSNTAANLQITNNGTTGAQGILMTITNAAVGLYMTYSSTAAAITIVGTTVFTGFDYSTSFSSGSPTAMNLSITASSSGSPNGINITLSSASGTCTAFVLNILGSGASNVNSYLFYHAANGMIASSSVGAGTQNKKVRVNIEGAVYYIPLYEAI